MSEAKHTPGRWVYRSGTVLGQFVDPENPKRGREIIAQHVSPENGPKIAAAPALLEALELLMHEVNEAGLGTARDFGWPKATSAARAAIAQAKGEA